MKKQTKFILFIVLIVILIGGVGVYASMTKGPGKYDEFAKCLTNSGAKFYGAFWCTHCQAQKKAFGSSSSYLPYVECSNKDMTQKKECTDAGVKAYPTWIFTDGTKIEGGMPFENLAEKTQCTLPITSSEE